MSKSSTGCSLDDALTPFRGFGGDLVPLCFALFTTESNISRSQNDLLSECPSLSKQLLPCASQPQLISIISHAALKSAHFMTEQWDCLEPDFEGEAKEGAAASIKGGYRWLWNHCHPCPRPQKAKRPSHGEKPQLREATPPQSLLEMLFRLALHLLPQIPTQFEPVCFTGGVSSSIN